MRDVYLDIEPDNDGMYAPDLTADGDFTVASKVETEGQVINQLILANTGDFREFPAVGVGLSAWLKDESSIESLKSNIAQQMKLDGFTTIQVSGNTFQSITANGRY